MFNILAAAMLLTAQEFSDKEKMEIDALVAETVRAATGASERQALLEKRVDLCRAVLKVEDWPSYIGERVKADPTLGDKVEIIEDCMFFIHGKQDALGKVINEDEELLRSLR